jgi:hypothetical protein
VAGEFRGARSVGKILSSFNIFYVNDFAAECGTGKGKGFRRKYKKEEQKFGSPSEKLKGQSTTARLRASPDR